MGCAGQPGGFYASLMVLKTRKVFSSIFAYKDHIKSISYVKGTIEIFK